MRRPARALTCALVTSSILAPICAAAQQAPPPVTWPAPPEERLVPGASQEESIWAPLPAWASAGAPAPQQTRDAVEEMPRAPRSFRVDVGVETEFPISMGGYLGAELPGRLLLQVGAGVMPSSYSSAVNGVLTGVGAYDANVGDFIQNAITNSFVLRLSGGWRPFRDHGFEILGGYTLLTLGGSAAEGNIVNVVLAEARSSQRVPSGSGATIPISATLHNMHASLGWRWLAASDHLVIRASISYLQCLAANLGATLPASSQSMQTTVNDDLQNLLAPYFTHYVNTPLVGLSAGYRF